MPPPDVREYSSLGREMPALTMFVHRTTGMMQELNERIDNRKSLIAGHAREAGIGAGIATESFIYCSSMLADEGEVTRELTELALNCWRLVLDQSKAYMTAKAQGELYVENQLIPLAVEAMPDKELSPCCVSNW